MTRGKTINEQAAADALAALGNRTRLRIFKVLIRAGRKGSNIGTIQRLLRVPATTLSHHLGTLAQAGLISQDRQGREVICTANFKAVTDVLGYVKSECCAGVADTKSDAA